MKLVDTAIRRPVSVIVGVLLIALFGLIDGLQKDEIAVGYESIDHRFALHPHGEHVFLALGEKCWQLNVVNRLGMPGT